MNARKMVGIVAVLLVAGMAQANVLSMGGTRDANGTWTGLASLETVPVGNPGNAAYEPPGYGTVSYTYKIGKYEVTAGQYSEFLNKVAKTDAYGLYNTYMNYDINPSNGGCNIKRTGSSGSYTYSVDPNWANRPVNYVSFWDAARFANWLNNGQPTGAQDSNTTERGAYTLDGYNGTDGRTIQRNADANWAVTSEDEWYKAAYHKNDGVTGNYWDYPTSSNTTPGQDMNDASGNNANCHVLPYAFPIDNDKCTTLVGEFQNSDSPYGTFDQGGNVWELNESIVYQDVTYGYRGLRGGAFGWDVDNLRASHVWHYADPTGESDNIGFRIVEVPEPATMAILACGVLGLLKRRKNAGR